MKIKSKAVAGAKETPVATPQKKPGTAKTNATKTRLRLSPEVRRRQILDAALIEFSALGFTAASISKIAERAGTSKANLYVHFANKDEIFETLLTDVLAPPVGLQQHDQPEAGLDDLIDSFIEKAYGGLTPQTIAVIRLVISESHRVPSIIRRWYENTVVPVRAKQQLQIDQYVAEGQILPSPLTEHFSFIMVPVLCVAVVKMVFGQEMADMESGKIKETHRKVLRMLLKPRPEGT